MWARARGFESASHRMFAAQAAAVRAGGSDLAGLGAAYPPTPTLLAALVPGGTLGLSVVASLFAGCTLQLVWEQLVRRDFAPVLTGCLLLPLFAVPAVAYAASQSVAGIALLSLLAIALHGFVRFTVSRDTEAGFITGLALAAAFTVDPIAIFYALALGTATWFIAHERFGTERFGARATVAVIVFPTVFAVLSWMFLEWRFAGAVFGTVAADPAVLTFTDGVWPALRTATVTVGAALLHVPLFVAVGVVYAVRRPVALVGYLTSVAGVGRRGVGRAALHAGDGVRAVHPGRVAGRAPGHGRRDGRRARRRRAGAARAGLGVAADQPGLRGLAGGPHRTDQRSVAAGDGVNCAES